MILIPIVLLQKQLTEMQRDLKKSKDLYHEALISYELHELHKKNLEPKIKEYKQAIKKLLE